MDSWDLPEMELEPHFPQVLRSDDAVRAIAIHLPAGEELQEHEVREHAYLVVAAGEVDVEQGGDTVAAGPGWVGHFEPHERHEVRAKADSRLLLVLAPWPGEPEASHR